jgi:outer membrane protein TolC
VVNPARYEAARQRAAADTSDAQAARIRAEVAHDARLALHDREHWREVRDELGRSALAPTAEALRLARVAYEAGTQDLTPVLLARQRLEAVEEQLAHVAGEVQRADIRLAGVTGDLTTGGAP